MNNPLENRSRWIIDIINDIHPDFKDAHAEAVETKTMVEGEVVTRFRVILIEKDGTKSFVGDADGPFIYENMTLANRDVQTFNKWKVGEL